MHLEAKRLKVTAVLLLAGVLYYLEIQTLGWTVPCIFRTVTGLECPGCGITRAILFLLQGNIRAAVTCNAGLSLALPLLVPYLLVVFVRWITGKPSRGKFFTVIGIALIVYLLIWGVIRNVLNI